MIRSSIAAAVAAVTFCVAGAASAQFATKVISYDEGVAPSPGFTIPVAALGGPQGDTSFGPVTPFNPPFSTSDIVSIGEGGQITLRLSNFILPQAGEVELGIFANVGIVDTDFPNGQAGVGPTFSTFGPAFSGMPEDAAEVSVSEDGITWVSLTNQIFDIPTAGFQDVAATLPADFTKPFIGVLDDFEGLSLAQMLTLLDGSAGGTWLDISATGLSQVGFVRLSLADDLDPGTSLNFDLDAVTISSSAIGARAPEPTSLLLLAIGGIGTVNRRRR
ncbi:MAG: PEP-CTERM sorting domain-containing protein [Planctomycetota bacterium]